MQLPKDDQKPCTHRQPPHLIIRHTCALRVNNGIDQHADEDADSGQGCTHNIPVKDLGKQFVRTPEKYTDDNSHNESCPKRLNEKSLHVVRIAQDLPERAGVEKHDRK